MNIKQQLQQANDRLDKYRRKVAQAGPQHSPEVIAQFNEEVDKARKKIEALKAQQSQALSSKGNSIKSLSFNRPLSKAEQADLGKLKKAVRGLVVVHPMTALGKQSGITVVTGFAPAKF